MHVRFDGEFGEGEGHAGEDVDDDLPSLAFFSDLCYTGWVKYLLGDACLVPAKNSVSSQ